MRSEAEDRGSRPRSVTPCNRGSEDSGATAVAGTAPAESGDQIWRIEAPVEQCCLPISMAMGNRKKTEADAAIANGGAVVGPIRRRRER